eukprot:14808951-Alexandrium_andersonii.AAC.1
MPGRRTVVRCGDEPPSVAPGSAEASGRGGDRTARVDRASPKAKGKAVLMPKVKSTRPARQTNCTDAGVDGGMPVGHKLAGAEWRELGEARVCGQRGLYFPRNAVSVVLGDLSMGRQGASTSTATSAGA